MVRIVGLCHASALPFALLHQLVKARRTVSDKASFDTALRATTPSVTLIHTADWQLGMRRNVFSPETQGRFAQDRLDAIHTLMEFAHAQQADLVVVAGDVFDDNLVDRQTVLRALAVLARAPKIPTFLLPANHDPLDPASVYKTPMFLEHCPEHVTVLTDMSEHVIKPGVVLVGAPWRTRRHTVNPLTELTETLTDEGMVRIIVAHGGVDTAAGVHDTMNVLRETELNAIIAAQHAQYIALGDRHSTTQVGPSGRVYYSGAPEPTSPRETDPGNVLKVTVSRDAITVEPKKVSRWQFINKVVTIEHDADVDQLITWLMDASRDQARTVLRLALQGVVTLAQHAKLDDALHKAAEVYASVTRWERHDQLVIAPDERDLDQMRLSGFVAEAFTELRNGAAEDAVAADALSLLYALALKADR